MTIKEIENIVKLHELICTLKKMQRAGWKKWHLENERCESVADHIFGTCMLAIGIVATKKIDIDIEHVIIMLVLHETEEIFLNDLTPFDDISHKKEDGKKAVCEVFKDFGNSKYFLDIIAEFEENKTKESKFANCCDKLEADMQARLYDKNFNIKKADKSLIENIKLIELKKQGYNKVSQLFLQYDKYLYEGEFLDIANYLERLESENNQERGNE